MTHYAYIAAILALLAFGTWYTNKIETAGQNACKAEYESELREQLNSQVAETERLTAANSQLVLDLINKQPEIQTVYKTIEKKVNVYVKQNVACNLSRGAVSLRNISGDPQQLRAGFHPPLSESDTARPSTVTQRRAEEQHHEWGKLYINLQGKYKTLLNVCENNNKKAVQ